MIPKQLFFIWVGDKVPDFGNYAISNFKELNPKFKVDLIWMTHEQVDKSNDESIVRLLKEIDSGNYVSYPAFKNPHYLYNSRYFKLADLYRFEVIKRYGGIYLDLDCFPCKPFDDVILNNDGFCCDSYWDNNTHYRHRNPDTFFVGCPKGSNFTYVKEFKTRFPVQDPHYLENPKWIDKKEKFYNCKLKVEECDPTYYIEHFVKRSWKKK